MGPVSRTKSWLLALYLGTAPVQWLPGVDYEWVAPAKIVLFVLAVGAVFLGTLPSRLQLPRGLAGPLGFAALAMLSIPGLAQSNLGPSVGYLADVVYGATMLWCFYNVARLDDAAAKKTFERSAVIVAAFAVAALGLTVAGSGWQSPCAVASFHDTAFGCSRTGWSGGLALYLPILMVFVFRRDIGVPRRWLYLALAAGLVAGQVGVGGRGGLVASAVVIASFVCFFMPRRWKVLGLSVVLLAAAIVSVPGTLSEQFRLDEIPDDPSSLIDWDDVSSGRIGGTLEAAGYIADRPLAGHGIEAVMVAFGERKVEVHNLWLKWSVCGVLAPLLFLALVVLVLVRARRLITLPVRNRSVAVGAGLVIVAGLVLSMLEPGTPFGEFQNNALWWAAASVILGMAVKQPELGSGRWRWLVGAPQAGQPSIRPETGQTTWAA